MGLTKVLFVRMTAAEHEALHRWACDRSMTLSEAARSILHERLPPEGLPQRPPSSRLFVGPEV